MATTFYSVRPALYLYLTLTLPAAADGSTESRYHPRLEAARR